MKNPHKNLRRNNIVRLFLSLIAIILINIISSFIFYRFDLTSEKKYSLSDTTKEMIRKLDDIVYFKVFLKGDYPAGFKRLEKETREMLDEFRAYNDNIQYEFSNPSESSDPKERQETYKLLYERGLDPTTLRVNEKGEASQQIIFPGALVSYKGRELPVQLLQTQIGIPADAVLNNSIQSLEYSISNVIRKLTAEHKPKVAFVKGQGELNIMQTADIANALSEYYDMDTVIIGGKLNSLSTRLKLDSTNSKFVNKYAALIIARPTRPFEEKDKFLLDQFIMRGGKVLWLIDPVLTSMDSLNKHGQTIGVTNDVNLEDMLFHYGVRMNDDLVMDMSALPIPLKTGQIGNQPQFDFFPWYFSPLVAPSSRHPIVKNLNLIKTEFISSLDTLKIPGIKKTILLASSQYSRVVSAPVMISLEILRHEPDKRMFNRSDIPLAVLLEGEFPSLFTNRIPPEIATNKELGVLTMSKPTKMIMVADGDVIKNQFNLSKGYPLPLGYDQYTGQTYGNKDFILNAMNYLCDESDLLAVRSRELKIRKLDMSRVNEGKIFWQLLNTLVPVILVLVYALVRFSIRKRRYAK